MCAFRLPVTRWSNNRVTLSAAELLSKMSPMILTQPALLACSRVKVPSHGSVAVEYGSTLTAVARRMRQVARAMVSVGTYNFGLTRVRSARSARKKLLPGHGPGRAGPTTTATSRCARASVATELARVSKMPGAAAPKPRRTSYKGLRHK